MFAAAFAARFHTVSDVDCLTRSGRSHQENTTPLPIAFGNPIRRRNTVGAVGVVDQPDSTIPLTDAASSDTLACPTVNVPPAPTVFAGRPIPNVEAVAAFR